MEFTLALEFTFSSQLFVNYLTSEIQIYTHVPKAGNYCFVFPNTQWNDNYAAL